MQNSRNRKAKYNPKNKCYFCYSFLGKRWEIKFTLTKTPVPASNLDRPVRWDVVTEAVLPVPQPGLNSSKILLQPDGTEIANAY